jgi:FAD-dependent oxidoreductase domain-containing protein 1
MGASTAYHLAQMRNKNGGAAVSDPSIVVVERDVTYRHASSSLSAGGIRQQFSLKENIEMCLYGRDFLHSASTMLATEEHDVDVNFQEHGYLFLTSSQAGAKQMKANHELQQELGCETHLLTPSELRSSPLFGPWLCGDTSDVTLASYSHNGGEGYFDPWALRCGFQRKSAELGAHIICGEAIDATVDPSSQEVSSVQVRLHSHNNKVVTYKAKNIVNAAGPRASTVMNVLAGSNASPLHYPLPVRPRKRCIFFFQCNEVETNSGDEHEGSLPPPDAPLMIDADASVYFRPEGLGTGSCGKRSFLSGFSPRSEEDPDHMGVAEELDVIDHEAFQQIIWPHLYGRVPAFGSLKVQSYWAGFYDYNTIDQNAILGAHPERPNVFLINGFSGHGLQQSPAAGRATAELIEHNHQYQTLDLSIFSVNRLLEGGSGPVYEAGIV